MKNAGMMEDKEFLASLTPRRKGILLLHFGYKFNYKDLASAFGIEESTAKSHVYKIVEAYVEFCTRRERNESRNL